MNVNPLYRESIEKIAGADFLDFEKFRGKTFFITGATGLIGRVIIDVLRFLNLKNDLNAKIFALTRNIEKAREKFTNWGGKQGEIEFIEQDARDPIPESVSADFIICGASTSHPVAYSNDPEGTIDINFFGAKNIISLAKKCPGSRTIFLSSNEIYGNNSNGLESFSEKDCGYIDCNTVRACYNEAKRLCECLFQIAKAKNNVDFVTVRLSRVFGATMTAEDSKASAQFIRDAVNGRDIVLKSPGLQRFSYLYVADAVTGIFLALIKGISGEVYNIGGDAIRLRDFARICGEYAKKQVTFGQANAVENSGFSASQDSVLNDKKIRDLGWRQFYSIESALNETLEILSSM